MKKLVHDLVRIRVRPYYIYQCDPSEGISPTGLERHQGSKKYKKAKGIKE